MGWFNRLCIKQLMRALPIARERKRLAAEAYDFDYYGDYVPKQRRVSDLEKRLAERIAREQSQKH